MNDTPIKALIPGKIYKAKSIYGLSDFYVFIKHIEISFSKYTYAQFYLYNTTIITTLGENEWKFYEYNEKV
jgi:hypothetical protein